MIFDKTDRMELVPNGGLAILDSSNKLVAYMKVAPRDLKFNHKWKWDWIRYDRTNSG